MTETPVPAGVGEQLTVNLISWLADLGLQFNPFSSDILNASEDPHLGAYLVGHEDFAVVWGDWITTILAPSGGGKTALRVRTAYAARVGEDDRRVFPVVYSLPLRATTFDSHQEALCRSAAYELLLEMSYRPERFEALDSRARQAVVNALDDSLPSWKQHFLPQLERSASPVPIAETFDRSALRLPNPPDPDRVRQMCAMLRHLPHYSTQPSVPDRWQHLIDLLFGVLHYEAIYVLVDGVDAYPETAKNPAEALAHLEPLLSHVQQWAEQRIFTKLFLPIDLFANLRQSYSNLLTFPSRFAKINWTSDRLAEVLAARMRIASEDEFDSLDALCTPGLRGLDFDLAELADPPIPREVLVLTARLLFEHVRRVGATGLLEPADLEAVRNWYRTNRTARYPQ